MIHKNTFICLLIGVMTLSCNKEDVSDSIITEPAIDSTTVFKNGLLRVLGNKIVNKHNVPISLAGNSFFWSNDNWGGERYYTPEAVEWLKMIGIQLLSELQWELMSKADIFQINLPTKIA